MKRNLPPIAVKAIQRAKEARAEWHRRLNKRDKVKAESQKGTGR